MKKKTKRISDTSQGKLTGYVTEFPERSKHNKDIYVFKLKIDRKGRLESDTVICHCDMRDASKIHNVYDTVSVTGSVKTHNTGSSVEMFFAVDYLTIEDADGFNNDVEISGTLCKPLDYFKLENGQETCKALVAVNFRQNRSAYIPVILWGKNANKAKDNFKVGDRLTVRGSYQSRAYTKKADDGVIEHLTTYEIFAKKMEV